MVPAERSALRQRIAIPDRPEQDRQRGQGGARRRSRRPGQRPSRRGGQGRECVKGLVGPRLGNEEVVVDEAHDDISADASLGEDTAHSSRKADRVKPGVDLQRDPRSHEVVGEPKCISLLLAQHEVVPSASLTTTTGSAPSGTADTRTYT